MILGTEVSDNLCSISRLAVAQRVAGFFGLVTAMETKITAVPVKKTVYLGKDDVTGLSAFLLKWREIQSSVFWKEKYFDLWNMYGTRFWEGWEYKEVNQSCISQLTDAIWEESQLSPTPRAAAP